MNSNTEKNGSDYKSSDEAFEYLLNKRLDEKRKKEWTEAFNKVKPAETTEQSKPTGRKTLYLKIASIAAGLVMIVGSFWMLNNFNSNDNLSAQNYIDETKVDLNYSSESRALEEGISVTELPNNVQDKLSLSLQYEDFGQMLGIYRSLEKDHELSIRDKYYYSICLLKSPREDKFKAIRLLDEVIKNDKNLEVEALYFRGLAKIETGKNMEAESDLELILTKSDYKKEKINNILKHLK